MWRSGVPLDSRQFVAHLHEYEVPVEPTALPPLRQVSHPQWPTAT